MRTRSSPCYSLPVVDECRPVQADAYPHVMLLDERNPALIYQCRVGLECVDIFSAVRLINACNLREGFLVVIRRNRQRLSQVPEKVDLPVVEVGPEHFGSNPANYLNRHPLPTGAAGKVTVLAIDVAEGCRLQHNKGPVDDLMSIGGHQSSLLGQGISR